MRLPILSCLMVFALASCAAPSPTPVPSPRVPPPVKPTPAPNPEIATPALPQGHWTDWPMQGGSWVYRRDDRGSIALFGLTGRDAIVTLRCDKGRGRIYLSMAALSAGSMTVRTSSMSKTMAAQPTGGQPAYVAAELLPADSVLDAMAFSRGRLAIELAGSQSFAIPVWAEIGRVVEDCR